MEKIKQEVINLLTTYNQGRPVNYPAIDRKLMALFPEEVKAGKLGPILDEMVAANLILQVGGSAYQAKMVSSSDPT